MSDAPLQLAREGAVAVVRLNRPEKLNALNRALVRALTETFRSLSADESLRAIVLTGAGRAFCVGVDLKELEGQSDISAGLDWHGGDSLFGVIRACPHPVISAINGFAVTGGLELALMGDFLIASDTAKFADTHARVGITPSWGMTQVLPRLIGINRARQMSLTGGFIDASTALAWGLVNEVHAPEALMPRARALAQDIAETEATTARRLRHLIALSAELPLTEGLAREVGIFSEHIAGVSPESVAEGRARVTDRGQKINRGDRSQ